MLCLFGSVSGAPADLKAAIARGDLAGRADGEPVSLDAVKLLPVLPNPDKILCVGLNYAAHVKETGREQKTHPAIFTRWADTFVADGAPILRPAESERHDYEGKRAIVIGKGGRRIPKAEALDHATSSRSKGDEIDMRLSFVGQRI